jgi:7-cyano-7-deazaguanine synthase
MSRAALVVLSGGQDSTTCLAWAKTAFDEVHAITFDYNQRHRREIDAAVKVAELLGVKSHKIVKADVARDDSPLTNPDKALETYTDFASMDATIGNRVELTYVPHRNMTFLLEAAKHAETLGIRDIVTGVCEADNANYPDCRGPFISALEHALTMSLGIDRGDRGGRLTIHTPLISMSKGDSVRFAKSLPGALEALAYSHTCYAGEYPPCGKCHACVLRAHGFADANIPDPLVRRAEEEAFEATVGSPPQGATSAAAPSAGGNEGKEAIGAPSARTQAGKGK